MTINSFDELKVVLKSKLPEFLEKKNVKQSASKKNKYHSFYSDTIDAHPSMHLYKRSDGTYYYYCFSTNRGGDIFIANNALTNAPLLGHEFITQNVQPLCEMFDIDYNFRPLSPEEIQEINIKSVYNIIKDIINMNLLLEVNKKENSNLDDNVKNYLIEKEFFDSESIRTYALGYVPSWSDFIGELNSKGIDKKYLQKIGIQDFIFNKHNLLFTQMDEYGYVKGFAGRNCNFDKDNKAGNKYYNIENNLVYNKRSSLYNLNKSLKKKKQVSMSLYVCEGYSDAIALDKNGFRSAALCSTHFTDDHITLLQKLSETDIVLILDGDDAGVKNTAKIITEVMKGIRNFRVRIVMLPDGEDPDTFLRKHGKEGLIALKHVTPFEWQLEQLKQSTDLDGYEIAKQMIPLVVNESSNLQRDRMCVQLSSICDVPIHTIRKEVDAISDASKIQIQAEQDSVIDSVIKSLKKSPTDAQLILSSGLSSIRQITASVAHDLYGGEEFLNELYAIKHHQESDIDTDYFKFWRMPRFETRMKGTMPGKLLMIGGHPNTGKTTWMVNMAVSVLKSTLPAIPWGQQGGDDRDNNAMIFFHSTDDSRRDIVLRFLSHLAFEISQEATINAINNPNIFHLKNKPLLLEAREEAFRTLIAWAKSERLVIKDASVGNNLITADNTLRFLKEKYPDRNIIYIADNVYNYSDFSNEPDDVARIKKIVNIIKTEIVVPMNITAFATIEYRKSDKSGIGKKSWQSLNETIAGSKALEYRADWVGHLWSDLYISENTSNMWVYDSTVPEDLRNDSDKCPIIKLIVSKNKISGWKGEIHYVLFGKQSTYFELTKEDINNLPIEVSNELSKWYNENTNVISGKGVLEKMTEIKISTATIIEDDDYDAYGEFE